METLPVLCGRRDINGTLRNIMRRKRLLHCEYGELSVNNKLNSIMKSTMLLLMRSNDVKLKRKKQLRAILPFFDGIDEINLCTIKWSVFRFGRCNRNYRILMNICYFIADGAPMTTEAGELLMPTQ